jgi:hypothetical protein
MVRQRFEAQKQGKSRYVALGAVLDVWRKTRDFSGKNALS